MTASQGPAAAARTVSEGSLRGLSAAEAALRLRLVGPNKVAEPRALTPAQRLVRSLRDPLVLVLLTALVLTLVTRDFADSAVIGLVVLVNSAIGLRQELQAEKSVRALSSLLQPMAWAVRSGQACEVPSAELVPGDLVLLRQGDLVPADAMLVEGSGVQLDESMMTGESFPVDKEPGLDPGLDPDATGPWSAEAHSNALLSGTVVVHGHGRARVTATGPRSTVGGIAAMMASAFTLTPLQRRMTRLSAYLAVTAIGLSSTVLLIGLVQGQPLEVMVLTTVALIVAAVPESLPLVLTVGLALAARHMAARGAVVRDLAAVETLGSVTLLATDKTGTLTQGSMSVADIWQPPGADGAHLVRAFVLCNDATLDEESGRSHGDPTDSALLRAAITRGADVAALRAEHPRVAELSFDSTRKAMVTTHRDRPHAYLTLRKGAPEAMLVDGFLGDGPAVLEVARRLAHRWGQRGMRVLSVAQQLDQEHPDDNKRKPRLLCLVGLRDPVRDSSRDTVAACRAAGLRVVLITGDHAATAHAVAAQVGIGDGRAATPSAEPVTAIADRSTLVAPAVIARATPADKHAIVIAFQRSGHVVAMTGDGVNDAPALRQADIGIAMGRRGTEVARQAADLILTDDNLGTLVAAVEEGRRVYDNLRRFLAYGISGGGSEVVLMLLGPFLGVPLPLLPAQILWLNLLTHSFAGAGLAVQPADRRVLLRGPRPPNEGPLAAGLWWRAAVIAAYLAIASLAAVLLSPQSWSHSAALLVLGAGQLGVAWGVRTPGTPVWQGERRADPMVPALMLAGTMLVASVTVPVLRELLDTQAVGASVWGLAAISAVGAVLLTRLMRTGSV